MSEAAIATGELWRARNWSADAGEGSIHDDATASELGFRGGTVAGSIHMDQCAALLVDVYGKEWFERGGLSLFFLNATTDGEAVQVSCDIPADRGQARVWVRREDGLDVAAGTASFADHSQTALKTRDLRPAGPGSLRILSRLQPGEQLGEWDHLLDGARQLQRIEAGTISTPLDWYSGDSPWGGPIATTSTAVELLWGVPMAGLERRFGESVGLFGAIEVVYHTGPLLLDHRYTVTAEIVALSESPKTESVWFDSFAHDGDTLVASHRIMLRVMKASSPLYQE